MGVKCAAGSAALGVNTAKTHKENLTVQIPLLCPSRCWSAFGTLPFYCEHGDVPKSNSHQETRGQAGDAVMQVAPVTSGHWEPSYLCPTSQANCQ